MDYDKILEQIYDLTQPKYAIWDIEDYADAMEQIRTIIQNVEYSEE